MGVLLALKAILVMVFSRHPRVRNYSAVLIRSLHRRADVLLIGDSFVEKHGPRAIGDETVYPAGFGGATAGDLLPFATPLAKVLKPARVIVSVGINNSQYIAGDVARFEQDYRALLSRFGGRPITLVEVSRLEADMEFSPRFNITRPAELNAVIHRVAAEHGYAVVPSSPDLRTIDGVHLDPESAALWQDAIRASPRPLG